MTEPVTLTHPAVAPATEPEVNSVSWEELSCEELKDVVARGVQGGEWFYAASRELQRRAALATASAEEHENVQTRSKQRQTQIVLLVIAVLVVVATAAELSGLF